MRTWQKWSKDEESLLGRYSDKVVSKMIGRSAKCVLVRRLKLGICPARRLIIPPKKWHTDWDVILGSMTDYKTAKRLGVSYHTVRKRRTQLGVKSYGYGRQPWTDEQASWLGKLPDALVAQRTGRSVKMVRLIRRLMNRPELLQ